VTIPNDQFDPGHDTQSNESPSTKEITADFRRDLAFPTLSEEMVQRLLGYGREEIVPSGAILYTQGDRNTDMFVVLDGGVDVLLPSLNGASKVIARHRKHDFSGEFSLLNSQRAVTEARTTVESRLLRISRSELRLSDASSTTAYATINACSASTAVRTLYAGREVCRTNINRASASL
jgi:thioredoxin reductase (NADPH)